MLKAVCSCTSSFDCEEHVGCKLVADSIDVRRVHEKGDRIAPPDQEKLAAALEQVALHPLNPCCFCSSLGSVSNSAF